MVRPASHSHSNGAAATTHCCRPSTKKITADAASGGSTFARRIVSPLTYESSAGDRIVSFGVVGAAGAASEGPPRACAYPAAKTFMANNTVTAQSAARLLRRIGHQWTVCRGRGYIIFDPLAGDSTGAANERQPIVGIGRADFIDEILDSGAEHVLGETGRKTQVREHACDVKVQVRHRGREQTDLPPPNEERQPSRWRHPRADASGRYQCRRTPRIQVEFPGGIAERQQFAERELRPDSARIVDDRPADRPPAPAVHVDLVGGPF